jgi:hypothetical protein
MQVFIYNGAISLYGGTSETSEVFNDGQLGNGKTYHALYLVLLHHQEGDNLTLMCVVLIVTVGNQDANY